MTPKEKVIALITSLPDDTSIDYIIAHLRFFQKIERGIAQADAGDVMSHEEFMADKGAARR